MPDRLDDLLAAVSAQLDALGSAIRDVRHREKLQRTRKRLVETLAELEGLSPAERRQVLEAVDAGLQGGKDLAKVHSVTDAQLARRGKAIAKGHARGDTFLTRLAENGRTQESYAAELGVTPGSLVAYRKGRPVPRHIAARVKKDLGLGPEFWPGGVVD